MEILDFSCCFCGWFTDDDLIKIIDIIINKPTLQKLILSDNCISDDDVSLSITALILKNNKNLITLNLKGIFVK